MDLVVRDGGAERSMSLVFGATVFGAASAVMPTVAELARALGLGEVHPELATAPASILGLRRGLVLDAEMLAAGIVPSDPIVAAGWRPNAAGRIPVIRPACAPVGPAPAPAERPDPPVPPPEPEPISWSAVLPGFAIAAVVAVAWSPLFALIGAASAAIPLLRALGPRLGRRRAWRRFDRARAAHQRELVGLDEAWAEAITQWLRARVSSPAELDRLLTTAGDTPWTRRHVGGDPVVLSLGRGRRSFGQDRTEGSTVLADAPIVVEVDTGLGIEGDRRDVLGVARWAVTELAFRHGPADVVFVVLTTSDCVADWQWVRWLPGLAAVTVDPQGAAAALDDLALGNSAHRNEDTASDRGPTPVIIVDRAVPSGPGSFAQLLAGQVGRGRVIWIGPTGEAPAVCRQRVWPTAEGMVRTETAAGWAWRLTAAEAEEFARFLAPFEDAAVGITRATLPESLPLAQLVDADPGAAWEAADRRHVWVPLGVNGDGPIRLDLVADGPHTLVAGTTGSGKSELLRTLVVGACLAQPPELVSFLLIDFKGGGAFDAVKDLAHVAAVVTDLEPDEARRALRSLRSELRDRERLLRSAGTAEWADLVGGPPRLVVVVDEFAALADELPDFLEGLVDVARRGRSLGVHLVLATQRPAGVVTAQIRANTNLRICLRVRDGADSFDVIDTADAATLAPIPGRAMISIGGSPPGTMQVAYLAGVAELCATPFVLTPAGSRPVSPAGGSWLDGVIDAVARRRPEANRPPWLVPLPSFIPAEVMWALTDGAERPAGPSPIGALDDPDRRRQSNLVWDPESGGLVVAGIDGEVVANTIAVAVTALSLDRPDVAVMVLDVDSTRGQSALARLSVLSSVVDVVGHREPDRVLQALAVVENLVAEHDGPVALVVARWGPIAESLANAHGVEATARLERLLGHGMVRVVVGVASDRELPPRLLARLDTRLVHRLADPSAGSVFGLTPGVGVEGGTRVIDSATGLRGVVATLTDHALARVAAWSSARPRFAPVRVLGPWVDPAELPAPCRRGEGWQIPLGLDVGLVPRSALITARRPLVVLGRPGSGRSSVLALTSQSLADLGEQAEVIDDADQYDDDEVRHRLRAARDNGRAAVVAATPAVARAFAGWLAPLLNECTLVVLNPSRADGEAVRVTLADLSGQPVGRAALIEHGQATIIQLAAPGGSCR